ncbi:MAG: lysylphosphatidylglycerol synthase transmembrane domain-containing protein [Candidatus Acidiferrales bacterium]
MAQHNGGTNSAVNQSTETRISSRAMMFTVLRVGGSVIILALLFHFLPLRQVWAAMGQLPFGLWLLMLAGYLLAHTIAVSKWRMMVNLAGAGLSFAQAARSYFAGLFSTLFLPSIVGGDVVRAGLALKLGRSKAGILLGSLLDRFMDVTALGMLAMFGALFVPGSLSPASRKIFLIVAAAFGALLILLGAIVLLLPARRFSYRMRRRLVRLVIAWRSLMEQPQYVLVALSLAIVVQGIFVVLTAKVAAACGLQLPLRVWLFAWPLAKIAALVPLTQGGIGVREAALAALLRPFGAHAARAVAVGLVWETIIISGGFAAGLTAYLLGHFARETRLVKDSA